MKDDSELVPREVMQMPLKEFEERFKFRPTDAFQKYWFAISGEKDINPLSKEIILAGVVDDPPDLSKVVMV